MPVHSSKSYLEGEQIFCMNLREDTNTHKFTGETSNRLWGKYISHELSEELSNEWKLNKDKKNTRIKASIRNLYQDKLKAKAKQEESKQLAWQKVLLSVEEKNREIRRVINCLTLSDRDFNSLLKRGLTREQIFDYQYKSVQIEQPLAEPVNENLAGVAPGGMNLNNKFSGLLIPISNEQGQYLGWQYRLNTTLKNKYLWAKSESETTDYDITSHLKETLELPLAYCVPESESLDSEYIGLAEGVGFKPQITANQYNQIVLGAAGGMFASSPKNFERYLNAASSRTGAEKVIIYPDAGAVKNSSVLRQYNNSVEFLHQKGYKAYFAWWGQIDKEGNQDIDEGEKKDFALVDSASFFALGKQYSGWHPAAEKAYREDIQKIILNDSKIASKMAANLRQASSTKDLERTINNYKNRFSDRFENLKKLAWQNLDSSEKAKIQTLLKNSLKQINERSLNSENLDQTEASERLIACQLSERLKQATNKEDLEKTINFYKNNYHQQYESLKQLAWRELTQQEKINIKRLVTDKNQIYQSKPISKRNL